MREVGGSRYTVSAVAKALQLLSAFSLRDRQASLAELATRTGIPRATAFRLLATLEEEGFVVKEGGEYRPGFKCFIVGNVAAAGLDLRKEARPQLVKLRDETGETAQVAILDSWQVVYLERVLSRQAVGYMTSRAGAILPAYCTGLGKVLLAYRPESDVVGWASTQTFRALTPNTITTVERMVEEMRAIRDRGYGVDEQEREVGVRCIAAPIRDHEGDVVAALSVAGPSDRMPQRLVGSEMASRVVAAAGAISARLGYTPSAAAAPEPRALRRPKVASLA
jgi:DNA-binding IclR family transcriptional regulator